MNCHSNMRELPMNCWNGVPSTSASQIENCIYGISSAIVANTIASPFVQKRRWETAEHLLSQFRHWVVEQSYLRLPELGGFFPELVEVSFQVLSRRKEGYLNNFVRIMEFCCALYNGLLSIGIIDGPLRKIFHHYGKTAVTLINISVSNDLVPFQDPASIRQNQQHSELSTSVYPSS